MRNGQKMIYNAGSMFTAAQWNERKKEGSALKALFPEMIISNPVDFEDDKTQKSTNAAIFVEDYTGLRDADYVILEIDGWDAGTHMEFGLVVEQALNNPQKYLLPVISDFRFKKGVSKGEICGFGLNEMFSGVFQYPALNLGEVPQIIVCDSHETARNAIQALENHDLRDFRKRFDSKNLYQNNEIYYGFEIKR